MKKQASTKSHKTEQDKYPFDQFVKMIDAINEISDQYVAGITDCELKKRAEVIISKMTILNSIDLEAQKRKSKFSRESSERLEYEGIFEWVYVLYARMIYFSNLKNKDFIKKIPLEKLSTFYYSAFRIVTNDRGCLDGFVTCNVLDEKPDKANSVINFNEISTDKLGLLTEFISKSNLCDNLLEVVKQNLALVNMSILMITAPFFVHYKLDYKCLENKDDEFFILLCLALGSDVELKLKRYLMVSEYAENALALIESNRNNPEVLMLASAMLELGQARREIEFLPHKNAINKGYYPTSGRKPGTDKAIKYGSLYVEKCIELMKSKTSAEAEPEAKDYISNLHKQAFGKGLSNRQIQRYQATYYASVKP